ncbi:META domain-containing protein [Nocardioides sp. AE5]|uniref:META domain-containing protein n=1 Tax=Nocardioides sp. AE5 TaxID=2962573 RepID=UPI002880F871|nr:META domain-containing protein [Nocardioides sp. AE5]MDT0201103.1 META domain-containing protein [Nocardioides sp. AE5]
MKLLPRTSSYAVLPAVVLALLLFAACGSYQGMTPGTDPVGSWVVTSIVEAGEVKEPVDGTEIGIEFTDDEVRLQAGCNSISGRWTLSGDELNAGPMMQTEMGCDPPRMEQDAWLVRFFGAPVTIGADPLTLTSGDTTLTLTPRGTVHPDRDFTGVTWHLDTIIEGELASSVPAGVEATLALDEDGNVSTHDGCNGGSGTATVSADTITFSGMMSTLMGCMDARGEVSTTYRSVLTGTVTWQISGDRLKITNGERTLGFVAG